MEPLTVGVLVSLVTVATQLAKEIGQSGAKLVRKRRKAASEFSLAVVTTQGYLDHIRNGGIRSKVQEQHLSRLWDGAYSSLLGVVGREDRARIEPLRLKKYYWQNPKKWSEADVKRLGIRLSIVRSRLRKFLKK